METGLILRPRLQEGSDEGAEADQAAGGGLDVGNSSASRLGGSAGAGGSARAGGTAGTTGTATRCSSTAAGRGGAGRGRGTKDDSGAVVGADNDRLGAVDVGGRAGEEKRVDASADGGDRGHRRLRGDGRGQGRLDGVNSGLGGDSSDDAERVGLRELRSLGEWVN